MATNKLNTEKIFKGIRKEFWRDLAGNVKNMIRRNMEQGFVQEYGEQTKVTSGGAQNYSKGYKKYKANYMNRFTDGKKLKAYAGKSVMNNQTNSVNMMLTGQTIKGLHLEQQLTNGIIMAYLPADEIKVKGNLDMGRSITTLNQKNKDKVLDLYANELEVSIRKWCKDTLVISTK